MVHPGDVIRWRQLHHPVPGQDRRTGEAERGSQPQPETLMLSAPRWFHLKLSWVFKVLPPVYQDRNSAVGKNRQRSFVWLIY